MTYLHIRLKLHVLIFLFLAHTLFYKIMINLNVHHEQTLY